MVWRLPPPRIRPQPDGTASRSTSDAAEASVDGIRFMVRPRDGGIWRGLRCQTLVTPSDSPRVAIPGAVTMACGSIDIKRNPHLRARLNLNGLPTAAAPVAAH